MLASRLCLHRQISTFLPQRIGTLLSLCHFRHVHIRPRKIARGPKNKGPQSDGGIYIDEFEGGICQASSAIKSDLDATLSPQKPVSVEEAQRTFENIKETLPVGLYSFLVTAFVDIILILKRNNLIPHHNAESVLAQWLNVPDRQLKEADLEIRFGSARWAIVKGLLHAHLEMLDKQNISPSIRRMNELGVDPAVWKGFLRNAMLYIAHDRFHRRQLAEVILAIRNGTVPVEQPLKGDFNQRSVTLAHIFLGIAREFGSNTLAEFALDLLRDAGLRPSYAVIKDVMYTNGANRRRWMDSEVRGSGELKQHLKIVLLRYVPRAMRDRQINFEMNLMGKNTKVISYRRKAKDSTKEESNAITPPQQQESEGDIEKTQPAFESEVEREREESFVIHNILPSIGSDYFRSHTTNKENYASTSIAQVTENILLPMTPEEEEIAKDPSKIDITKYSKDSLAEQRKQHALWALEECKKGPDANVGPEGLAPAIAMKKPRKTIRPVKGSIKRGKKDLSKARKSPRAATKRNASQKQRRAFAV
ncbi:hypothetical protein XU18_1853 [Perkinsela sp. CCAP 1560/4]|nr:hypothetical protein XU18_1853 [Perkinsela sp. CCAP 1560/4]|eukprot:KNH07321.1 hypothetical protein XU18_1853 [Perkinsela sp. CCAP 1560/4]